jgi:hypothetical protein
MNKDEKFDRFIEDFDKSLNTDTSTLKTIGLHKTTPTSASPTSPLLTTPTKARRNSISPDEAPLKHSSDLLHSDKNGDSSVRPVKLTSELRRSATMGGLSAKAGLSNQPSRRGLNLGLNLSVKQQRKTSDRIKSPESRATSPVNHDVFLTPNRTMNNVTSQERTRRRTNSSASEYDELNDSLRILAAKEMRVIELREKFKNIQQELDREESELKALKNKIGNTIQKDLSPAPAAMKTNTPLKKGSEQKKESIWSKPVSFLNQFDQILQNEIEKLNKEGFKGTTSTRDNSSDDVINTVSNSLWTFMSDVKHGLLGDEGEVSSSAPKDPKSSEINEDEEEMITISK